MKIGLFGGTFNPVHIGHMALAKNVKRGLKLDKLIFIPSNIPPHKNTVNVGAVHRLEMTKLAAEILGSDEYEVSDIELKSDKTSYTYDTLAKLRDMYPDDELFFLCGTDIFATIETWGRWKELFDLANFVVVNRSDVSFSELVQTIPDEIKNRLVRIEDYRKVKSGKIILFRMTEVDISSTIIRESLNGTVGEVDLPENIIEYIKTHKLYGRFDD